MLSTDVDIYFRPNDKKYVKQVKLVCNYIIIYNMDLLYFKKRKEYSNAGNYL